MLSEIETVRQKLMNNATNEYDAVVSLGGSCASCLQIRKRQLQTLAYPFDYVFCVDPQFQFNVLADLFNTDFEKWLLKENMIPLAENEKGISDLFQYKDKYTEFRYIHDFKSPIAEEGVYDEFYQKYKRRQKRLYSVIERSERILFVSDTVRCINCADVKSFLHVLQMKWPGKTFDISILSFKSEVDEILQEEHVKIVRLSRKKNNYDFFGMNFEWGIILDSVKLSAVNVVQKEQHIPIKSQKVLRKDIVVLITGCSSGIGRSLSEQLLSKGYKVAITARNVNEIIDLEILYPEQAKCFILDVTDKNMVENSISSILENFGRIDILVNNAGVGYFSVVESIDIEQARRVFDVNFFGVLNMIQGVLPHMNSRNSGMIINISSISAIKGHPTSAVYSGSKAAMERLTESLRAEILDTDINVISLAYGETETNFYRNSILNDTNMPNQYGKEKRLLSFFKNSHFAHPIDARQAASVAIDLIENKYGCFCKFMAGSKTKNCKKVEEAFQSIYFIDCEKGHSYAN